MTPLPALNLSAGAPDAPSASPAAARERGAARAPGGFARELRQQQDKANRPPARGDQGQPDAASDSTPTTGPDPAAQHQRAADARARGKAMAAGEHPHGHRADGQGGAPDASGPGDGPADTDTDTDGQASDPSPTALAAGDLSPPKLPPGTALSGDGPGTSAPGAAPGPATATADGAAAVPAGADPLDPKVPATAGHARPGTPPAGLAPPGLAGAAEAGLPETASALASQADPGGAPSVTSRAVFADVLAAAGGAAAGAVPHAPVASDERAPAPPPLAGEIEPEVGSPGFAPALGARLTLLARDGVQEARLALHPADLGPITVQIAVDGAAAHIHFLADQAATRSAIEASLPQLASALREGGLTLAGGGVLQQGQGGGGQNAGAGRQRGGGRGTGADEAVEGVQEVAARRAARPQGVVDLYA